MNRALPIHHFRDRIVEGLSRSGSLLLAAPTGSGKSTQTPQLLRGNGAGRILVLEPRRLAARSLAHRVAAETGTVLGQEIGYQVRFDRRWRADTSVVFQTYGVFVQRLLQEPDLPGVGAVVLDEFHERPLEADLALAWVRTLRRSRRPDLRLAVMSATLDGGALSAYLPEAARVEVPGRQFPVDIRHFPAGPGAEPAQGALEALQELAREGLDGSVLVFMPGLREIRRSLAVLGPYCRAQGLALHPLHGSMQLAEQVEVLEPASERPRVIVATNVAETGLTIPGVTAVIDSGLHRVAAFDAARGINTLYVARISRANAEQRAGRAGRTAPGRCVRLWSKAEEAGMADGLAPEVSRLELSAIMLEAASLPEAVDWPTPPPEAAWSSARRSLSALGALEEGGRITARGRALLRYPAAPRLAAVLEDARPLGARAYERACAMAAVFETAGERRWDRAAELSALADDLLRGSRGDLPWEAPEVFRQLRRLGEASEPAQPAPPEAVERVWLRAFADRLAAREGQGAFYRLADGRGALLPAQKAPPPLILALEVRERAGGGQARQTAVSMFLPCSPEAVASAFEGECRWAETAEFDERRQRVVKEERLVFRGLAIARRELAPRRDDREAAAELWAEKFVSGELRHPGLDERAAQLVTRVALARRLYPDGGFPELGDDDWRLIYGEACLGRASLKDIERVPLLPHLERYLGRALLALLDRLLPTGRKLPSGKTGRFTYFESRPPELAARLGDFLKMSGTLSLCEGRLPVLFDILAPNHRTVQKTHDLGSFWANAYPTVKKELQRRYPKHPWP
ncbi:MAG: ATP-dependent helicase HrpB [Elusimicrobia bacterium]|nr:ATP-dependent helicase HrpB [Elusimicrobiota bacterium]